MKNKKLKIALLMALFSQAAYSVDVVLKPFGSTNATVSSKEPNIINVKNDTIVGITSKSGAILNDAITTDGSVIFSTSETKPFSILVETEKGFNFTVNATPNKKNNAASIIIYNLAEKGKSQDADSTLLNASDNSYSGMISRVLTELINHKVPDGFVETRKRDFAVPPTLKGVFTIRNTDAWVGEDMRIVKLDITNISQSEIELNERILWNNGVMAISFDPAATSLPPNRKVFAYVVLKEVE
mgnify:CR=1 FL=1|jgi:conjugal transfer protein traK